MGSASTPSPLVSQGRDQARSWHRTAGQAPSPNDAETHGKPHIMKREQILGKKRMGKYRQNNLFVAFTMRWRRSEGEGKETEPSIGPSPASASRKRKSPNTPNGVRAIVYPTREINTVNSPTLAMTQRRKGTTKDLKCKAGRVRNPGSQCVRVRNRLKTTVSYQNKTHAPAKGSSHRHPL